ncbi:hypothetical protein AALO_G00281050 [Alosa alosa]|uniref:Uncharacterized protein n=1 Tax=Alosa alosa TaxID=278164 RepID=A0AAV6FJU0_9TELE|nr:hypothetical protein AALO_G00281050 [Alosa alosa]
MLSLLSHCKANPPMSISKEEEKSAQQLCVCVTRRLFQHGKWEGCWNVAWEHRGSLPPRSTQTGVLPSHAVSHTHTHTHTHKPSLHQPPLTEINSRHSAVTGGCLTLSPHTRCDCVTAQHSTQHNTAQHSTAQHNSLTQERLDNAQRLSGVGTAEREDSKQKREAQPCALWIGDQLGKRGR